eukprot:1887238-Lingulodinium_polyedra.AAC.1
MRARRAPPRRKLSKPRGGRLLLVGRQRATASFAASGLPRLIPPPTAVSAGAASFFGDERGARRLSGWARSLPARSSCGRGRSALAAAGVFQLCSKHLGPCCSSQLPFRGQRPAWVGHHLDLAGERPVAVLDRLLDALEALHQDVRHFWEATLGQQAQAPRQGLELPGIPDPHLLRGVVALHDRREVAHQASG